MPANKYALLRYRIIDNCLTNQYKPFPTKEELRQACEDHLYGSHGEAISESTIEKDLWAMRNESELGYDAPIAYHSGHRGYYYTDPDYTIKDIALREEEVSAIQIAAQTLYQFRGIEPFNQFEKAIEKIMNKVSVASPDNPVEDINMIQFEGATGNMGSEHLGILLEAIRRRVQVEIRYQKFTAEEAGKYTLNPLLLKEYRNRWYLIAYRSERSMIQSFGLERMRAVNINESQFSPPVDFDAAHYFSKSIGITAFDANPVKVQFETTAVTSKYLLTQPVHESQRVISKNDEHTVFEIDVLITEELIMYLLSLGPNVRVLSPQSLVHEVRKRLFNTIEKYKD